MHTIKPYGRMEVWLHSFLFWALAGGEWSATCANHFNLGKAPLVPTEQEAGCFWEERIPIATRNWSLAIQLVESTLQLMNCTLHWGCWKSSVLICKIFPYCFGALVVLVLLWWTSFYKSYSLCFTYAIYTVGKWPVCVQLEVFCL